jgi:ABC-type uncharacterized transport system permease subunit
MTKEFKLTRMHCSASILYSAMHVLFALTIAKDEIWIAVTAGWFLGMGMSSYLCERVHNSAYIKRAMDKAVNEVLIVKEAEDIMDRGF